MKIQMTLNGKKITEEIQPGMLLLDFVRAHGCKSVKRGCETANCGLCTVFVDDKPVLSCSTLVARVSGHKVDTLEGLQEESDIETADIVEIVDHHRIGDIETDRPIVFRNMAA